MVCQPSSDIPVYEIKQENSKAKKTRTLHRNLLLLFMGIPQSSIREHVTQSESVADEAALSPQPTDETVFEPPVFVTDQNSKETANSGEADNHQVSDTYVIPMRRKPGVPGLKPRTRCPSVDPEPSQSTPDEEPHRGPERVKRKPKWMNSDWAR